MFSQVVNENHLAHDKASEVLENGGILRDSPILALQPAPDRAPSTAQELFDAVHAVVDVSWSSADALRDAVRQAIGLPPAEKPQAPALDRYFWEWLDRRIGIYDRIAGTVDAYGGVAGRAIAICRDTYTAEKIVAALNAGAR